MKVQLFFWLSCCSLKLEETVYLGWPLNTLFSAIFHLTISKNQNADWMENKNWNSNDNYGNR